MDASGGVPEPLLPPQVALQNPELVGGKLFEVVPSLGRIVVMIDSDGDENYVPYTIPVDGGFPEPLAPEAFSGGRSHLLHVDDATEIAYFAVESREEASTAAVRVDLASGSARDAVAERLRRVRRRVDARSLPRRARRRLHDGRRRPLRSRRGRANDALRDADRGARSRSRPAARRLPRRPRDGERPRASFSRRRCSRTPGRWGTSTSRGRARSSRSRSTGCGTAAQASSRASTISRATGTRSSTTSTAAHGRTPVCSTRMRARSPSSAYSSARASSRAASCTGSSSTRGAVGSSCRSAPPRARRSSTCSRTMSRRPRH